MKVGERRNIIIPPRLGYGKCWIFSFLLEQLYIVNLVIEFFFFFSSIGDRGAGGVIPGGATLYFDVELLAIQ